jgi:hypothetical protein
VHECAHPVFWQSGMSLPVHVFGEKDIARSECSTRAVADTDLHRPGQCNAPLPARGIVPSQNIAVFIVFKNQHFTGCEIKKNRESAFCSRSSKCDLPSSPVYILQNCMDPPVADFQMRPYQHSRGFFKAVTRYHHSFERRGALELKELYG